MKRYFCISLALATTWALAGCAFKVVASYGTSMLVEVGDAPPPQDGRGKA